MSKFHLLGCPLHSSSTGVDSFFSLIFSYFWAFVLAFRPCHGSWPAGVRTIPRSSKDFCEQPLWHWHLAGSTWICIPAPPCRPSETALCPSACWSRHILRSRWGSCSPGTECADVCDCHETSLPDQNQSRRRDCPSCPTPLKNCRVWYHDEWNFFRVWTQFDLSVNGKIIVAKILHVKWRWSILQGSAKRWSPGLVNSAAAVNYHLPGLAFSIYGNRGPTF